MLKDIMAKASLGEVSSAITSTTLEYVAALCSTLIQVKNFDTESWRKVRQPASPAPARPSVVPPGRSACLLPIAGATCLAVGCFSLFASISARQVFLPAGFHVGAIVDGYCLKLPLF